MSHLSLATQREVEMVEAAKRLSVADLSTLNVFWVDDYAGMQRQNLVANTGTCITDSTRPSCIITATGATPSSIGGHYMLGLGSSSYAVPGGTGGEWYISARFLVTTAIGGNTILSTYAGNAGASSDYIALGVVGTTANAGGSNTKFVGWCNANGSPVVSAISIDTNTWHIARFYRKGSVTSLSIDSETAVTGNTYPTSITGSGGTAALNNGASTNYAIVTDWQFSAYVRTNS